MKFHALVFLGLVLILLLNSAFVPNENIKPGNFSDTSNSIPFQNSNIATGVHLRPNNEYGSYLYNFNSEMGKPAAILMYFLDWSGHPFKERVFDYYLVQQIKDELGENTPSIMLTWQPVIYGDRDTELGDCYATKSGSISPLEIIDGKCDKYIQMFAEDLAERQERYLIRFAHEMNISDSPWWPGHFNSGPDVYVKMWRHVHTVFSQRQKELGVNNVEWVWSINYASNPNEPWNAYYNYYPGDQFVDWIGLSGYNWNNPKASFTDIYGKADDSGASIPPGILHDLACRFAKPQIITEIGTAGSADEKVKWISEAFNAIPSYPFLKGIVWFNDYAYEDPKSSDFRVYSLDQNDPVDGKITHAYKQSINLQNYQSELLPLGEATPPRAYCGNGNPEYSFPKLLILEPNETFDVIFSGVMIPNDTEVIFENVPNGITLQHDDLIIKSPWGTATAHLQVNSEDEGTYKIQFKFGETGSLQEITIIVVQDKSQIYLPSISK